MRVGGRGEVKRFITVKTDSNHLQVCLLIFHPSENSYHCHKNTVNWECSPPAWQYFLKVHSKNIFIYSIRPSKNTRTPFGHLTKMALPDFLFLSLTQPFRDHSSLISDNAPSDFHQPTSPLEKIITPFKTTLLEILPSNQSFKMYKMFDIHLAQLI